MERLIEFLKEYAAFFEEINRQQEEKLKMLTAGEIPLVEEAIIIQQASDKQLQNMEQRRLLMFRELGYEGKTFKEVIEQSEGDNKKELESLFEKLNGDILNIKYLNEKAVRIAESALAKAGVKVPAGTESGQVKGYGQAAYTGGAILTKSI